MMMPSRLHSSITLHAELRQPALDWGLRSRRRLMSLRKFQVRPRLRTPSR